MKINPSVKCLLQDLVVDFYASEDHHFGSVMIPLYLV